MKRNGSKQRKRRSIWFKRMGVRKSGKKMQMMGMRRMWKRWIGMNKSKII